MPNGVQNHAEATTKTKELTDDEAGYNTQEQQSIDARNNLDQGVNLPDDKSKEKAARKEIPNSTTEVVETVNNGQKINIGITKDENTGKNENTVKEEPKEEPAKVNLDDGKNTVVDTTKVFDVPSAEIKPEEKSTDDEKEAIKVNGITSNPEFDDNEELEKEFSKQEIKTEEKAVEEDKKVETEAPVVEDKKEVTKEVLPTTESTEKEEATIVETKKEEKAVETTKEAPKAEVVEKTVEVKKEVKKQEEKPAPANAQFAETVVVASRDAKAQFSLTAGKIVTVQNSDEQIAVSNNGSSIVVTNNYPEFDGTVSFNVVDEAGQATSLTVIFK